MTKIIYKTADGQSFPIDATDGDNAMFTAVQNGVPGITGECGGVLSCATCHVYVDPDWLARLDEASPDESDMLEVAAAERKPGSRLACQIVIRPDLDGLVVTIPDEQ